MPKVLEATQMPLWRRPSQIRVCMDVWAPFVAIFIVLLFFFMTRTPMLAKGVSIDLARVLHAHDVPEADDDDALLAAVTRDGAIWFGSDRLGGPEALGQRFTARIAERSMKVKRERAAAGISEDSLTARLPDPKARVYIKADARVKYKYVNQILRQMQAVGLERVTFIVEDRESNRG